VERIRKKEPTEDKEIRFVTFSNSSVTFAFQFQLVPAKALERTIRYGAGNADLCLFPTGVMSIKEKFETIDRIMTGSRSS
jgi:hypothetical protein